MSVSLCLLNPIDILFHVPVNQEIRMQTFTIIHGDCGLLEHVLALFARLAVGTDFMLKIILWFLFVVNKLCPFNR